MFSPINILQVHDLVQIDRDSLNDIATPDWLLSALQSCPWAVVRRTTPAPGKVAIGVRGNTRDKRWGGFICKKSVSSAVRPSYLLAIYCSSKIVPRSPAVRILRQVIERWQDFDLPWGPMGSVALELVSGVHVTTKSSDLDIAINASRRIAVEHARWLWHRVADLQPRVDVRVETGECGFSLQEYVRGPKQILLRHRDGVCLGDDPWSPRPIPVRSVT